MILRLLPKVLYNCDNEKYFLHIYTEPRFMNPDKYEYVAAYISSNDVYCVKIQHSSLFVMLYQTLHWVYCGSAESWEMTHKPKKK